MTMSRRKGWVGPLADGSESVVLPQRDGDGPRSGNPILSGWYADPEVAEFDGRFWIFPTRSGAYSEQVVMDVFSSPDLITWTKHEAALDRSGVTWLRKCLWAPVAFTQGGRYYVIFSANDPQTPEGPWWRPEMASQPQDGGLGLAVADRPEGPYRDALGRPLIGEVWNGAQPIDAAVFRDELGALWMVFGGWRRCNLVRLRDDLTGLVPFADGSLAREVTPTPDYVEGPFMFKRAHTWYFLWSEGAWGQDNYRVAYARSASFHGPWTLGGVIMKSEPGLATGAGHCSVLQASSGTAYLFYHRRPIPNHGRDHRVVCVEKLEFATDGAIRPVRLTTGGVRAYRKE